MSTACYMLAPAIVAIAGSACIASDKGHQPEITIALQQPTGSFTLGRPIPLTAVFKSNLKRDVEIEGFAPEGGSYSVIWIVHGVGFKGCTTTERRLKATTTVVVQRLSGKAIEGDQSFSIVPSEPRSFVLKVGDFEKQAFDLMKTLEGAGTIDSPGRFRVSLVFKVRAETSKGYWHSGREWDGEARGAPIEINVIQDNANKKGPNTSLPAKSASRITAVP